MADSRPPLRVFFDTSALIAGSFSDTGASFALLQLAGLGVIEGCISEEVRVEAERNVQVKLPSALPALRLLISEVLTVGPSPSDPAHHPAAVWADPKDQPILVAALDQGCRFLVTLNSKDFWAPPEIITVIRPGDLIQSIRGIVSGLGEA